MQKCLTVTGIMLIDMSKVEFIGSYNIRTIYAPALLSLLKKANNALEWESVNRLEDFDSLIEALPDELIEEKRRLETLYDDNCADYSSVVRSSDGMHLCDSPHSFEYTDGIGRPTNKTIHVCGLTLSFSFYHDGCPSCVSVI